MNCQGSSFFNGMKKSQKELEKKLPGCLPFRAKQEDALWVRIRVEAQFWLCIFDGIPGALGFGSAESHSGGPEDPEPDFCLVLTLL